MPLVLVAGDQSLPWGDDAHPWRWGAPGRSAPGLFGTAIESCRKNLGLRGFEFSTRTETNAFRFEWGNSGEVPANETSGEAGDIV